MASKRKRKQKPHNLIPRQPTVHFHARLPEALHRELKRAAAKNRCSIHAEMLRRLDAGSGDVLEREAEWTWMMEKIKQIWQQLQRAGANGQQTAAGPAPQNGRAAQERASESRDG